MDERTAVLGVQMQGTKYDNWSYVGRWKFGSEVSNDRSHFPDFTVYCGDPIDGHYVPLRMGADGEIKRLVGVAEDPESADEKMIEHIRDDVLGKVGMINSERWKGKNYSVGLLTDVKPLQDGLRGVIGSGK